MAEDVAEIDDDFMTMQIDFEDENIVKGEVEESISDKYHSDPLLVQTPIVYTTKLDDMNTVKQNLTHVSAKEIITKMQSENKPIHIQSATHRSNAVNIESFQKLTDVVSEINTKAAIEEHNANVRNLHLLKQCKPLRIVLEDIKNQVLKTSLQNSNSDIAIIGSSNKTSEITNEVEGVDFLNIKFLESEEGSSSNRTNEIKPIENYIFEIIDIKEESSEEFPIIEINTSTDVNNKKSYKRNKEVESHSNSTKQVSSYKTRKVQKKKQLTKLNLSDEDNTPLINLKQKPRFAIHPAPYERILIIVLIHDNNQADMYRIVNATKLVSDYYVIHNFKNAVLNKNYPRKPKIIKRYCCWLKRAKIVSEISMHMKYPLTIQKFLEQPHKCPINNCVCCCRNCNELDIPKRKSLENSLTVADTWLRYLLKRRKSSDCQGLIAAALSYTPKKEMVEKLEIEPEKYLECVLICIKYSGRYNSDYIAEFYEVGNNGNLTRFFRVYSDIAEEHIRKKYGMMNHLLKVTQVSYCCWYEREKIINDFKSCKLSPSILKLMQMPHNFERNLCRCCCKAKPMILKPIELPKVIKHTTACEKTVNTLCIEFDANSRKQIKRNKIPTNVKLQNETDAIAADTVLPNCSSEGDNKSLKTSALLKKFTKLQLGVTSDGKLKTILNTPAKNLSIAELKELYYLLEFSSNQMIEFELSLEEFCKRVNSRSGQSKNTPIIQDTSSLIKTNTFKYISNLMATKNNIYVGSFKIYFQNITAETSENKRKDTFIQTVTDVPSLPKISQICSLKPPNSDIAIAGPSNKTRRPQKKRPSYLNLIAEAEASGAAAAKKSKNEFVQTATLILKAALSKSCIETTPTTKSAASENWKAPAIGNSQIDNRLRIKPAIELMDTNRIENPLALDTPNIHVWPAPILIKKDPETDITSFVNSFETEDLEINPLNSQDYFLKNSVNSSNNINVADTPATISQVYHMTGNSASKISSPPSNSGVTPGVEYVTLEPLIQTDSTDGAMKLQQIRTAIQTTANVPPLVPFRTAKKDPEQDNIDVESSIGYCVIIDNKNNVTMETKKNDGMHHSNLKKNIE